MSTPISVQFLDRMNNIGFRTLARQSDFDSDVISIFISPTMQPSLLLRIRTKIIISIKRTRLGSIKLVH
jgi:hypothetical protein